MYKLIRRISSSFFPRNDRPWNDDATSNAPQIGKKRRASISDNEEPPHTPKRFRAEPTEEDLTASPTSPTVATADEAANEGVKEVTEGVRDVELGDEKPKHAEAATSAAEIPLPASPVLETEGEGAKALLAKAEEGVEDAPIVQGLEVVKEDVEAEEKETVAPAEQEVQPLLTAEAAVPEASVEESEATLALPKAQEEATTHSQLQVETEAEPLQEGKDAGVVA